MQKTKKPTPTRTSPTKYPAAAQVPHADAARNGSGERKVQPAPKPPKTTETRTTTAPRTIAA